MNCYADTGFLVSLHSADAKSAPAKMWMKSHGMPMIWTWLHELQFRNAIPAQMQREGRPLHSGSTFFSGTTSVIPLSKRQKGFLAKTDCVPSPFTLPVVALYSTS